MNPPSVIPTKPRPRFLVVLLSTLCTCLLAGSIGAIPAPAASTDSAAQAPGAVSGRVENTVSGSALEKVRVAVQGSQLVAFTDQNGFYNLAGVPSGQVTLEVFYTGLDKQVIQVTVPPGGVVRQDIQLTSQSLYGTKDEVMMLDPYKVASFKIVDAQSTAINEQRFSPNIKTVVAATEFGNMPQGNVAEFMKYIPGANVVYEDVAPKTVSLRGFPAALTKTTVDGVQMANATLSGVNRDFEFKQVSINNVSRIEVTKVPTPANPADSLAGSVNMISKSAFETNKREFRYRFYLTADGQQWSFDKTPFALENYTYKIQPAFDFDFVVPLTQNFGIIVSGLHSLQWNVQDIWTKNYTTTGTGIAGVSPSNPFLQSYNIIDAPKYIQRDSAGIRADWRVTPHSILSFSAQANYYLDLNTHYNITYDAGANGTPTVTNGTAMTYGQNYTSGATGRGTIEQHGSFFYIPGITRAGSVRYRLDDGTWRVNAGLSLSNSQTAFRNLQDELFRSVQAIQTTPLRFEFSDIAHIRPENIAAYDNTGARYDLFNPRNYRVTTATGDTRDINDKFWTGDFDLFRRLDFLSFPASVQIGGLSQLQARSIRFGTNNYTYNGLNGDLSLVPLQSKIYNTQNVYHFSNIPWASPNIAYNLWQANPEIFTKTAAQKVSDENFYLTRSQYIKEKTSALYFQTQLQFFSNRLQVLTGVRYEKTDDSGLGPLVEPSAVYARNSDGSFVIGSNGQRVRRPEAGAVGSMEELRLTTKERAFKAHNAYDGFYPSLHLTYNLRENLIARAAYAKTYGRPDFAQILPNTTVNENDIGSVIPGNITINNTALKPWSADNYDFTLEYYSKTGGVISAGFFLKEIKDFFGTRALVATQDDLTNLGLPSQYLGWTLNTQINAGAARISGVEFNFKQSLSPLGSWAKGITVMANATKLDLDGGNMADFSSFIDESASWGFSYSRNRLTLMALWNYRGREAVAPRPQMGPGGYDYIKERVHLDANAEYQLMPRLFAFVSVKNAFNEPQTRLRYAPDTPEYAREYQVRAYGALFSFGVRGTF